MSSYPTCVVDNDLRAVSIPEGLILGVESDKDVLALAFQIPRYYHELDLMTMTPLIKYRNATGEGDLYFPKDMTAVGDDTITFSWLIGRRATEKEGLVTFSICLQEINGEDEVVREFNTALAWVPVRPGLMTSEADPEPSAVSPFGRYLYFAVKDGKDLAVYQLDRPLAEPVTVEDLERAVEEDNG